MGVFDGLKVLDFTHAYAGPFCTQILGDFGAKVIKVERLDGGDQARGWAPFKNDYSGYYASFNRGKRSLTVDIKTEEGQEILKKLIEEADVVCSNFKYGTLERYGLGYEQMKASNPEVIYVTNSGFGSKGEYASFAAYDNVIQGISGIMDVNGFPDRIPAKIGPAIGDSYSGLLMLLGLAIALYHKEMTGESQEVNVSMLGALYGLLDYPVLEYTSKGNVLTREGNTGRYHAPDDVYKAGDDEYVSVTVRSDEQWKEFCEILGIREEGLEAETDRLASTDMLKKIIEERLSDMTADEVEKAFEGTDIAAASVIPIDKALKDPQLIAREMVISVEDPVLGELKLVGDPIKLSDNEQILDVPSPTLGQHTEEILGEIGYKETDIAKLREIGIV